MKIKAGRILLIVVLFCGLGIGVSLVGCGGNDGENNGGSTREIEGLWRYVAEYEAGGTLKHTYPLTCEKQTVTYTTDRFVYFVGGEYRAYTDILNYIDFGLPQGIFTCSTGINGTYTLDGTTVTIIHASGDTSITTVTLTETQLIGYENSGDYSVFERIDLGTVDNAQDNCDWYDKWC